MAINQKSFFTKIRPLFGGNLSTSQVKGMLYIIQEWERRTTLTDIKQLAYIFATVFHETGQKMQPVEEIGNGKGKPYGKPAPNGIIYYGRGLVQVTWYDNFLKLKTLANKQGFKWDFVNNPDFLLLPVQSTWATFEGMIRGIFTGRKLSDYFGANYAQPVSARKIINGTDRAGLIAGYYKEFLNALN